MAISNAERTQIAQALLRCYGEDYYWCGRTMKFILNESGGNINLLSAVQTAALTWPPFVASGLSIADWNAQLARIFNSDQV